MERAAGQLFKWIAAKFGRSEHFIVFAGPGNNGGDGLALARMLAENRYQVEVLLSLNLQKRSLRTGNESETLENVTNVTINL